MKRNLLLLTAVVLTAVLLAGCTLPIIGNAVKIKVNDAKNEAGKVLIEAVDLEKEYKKNAAFEITFEYTKDYDGEKIEFKFEPKDTEATVTVLEATIVPAEEDDEPKEEPFRGGFKVEGKTAKKNITITTSVKPDTEDEDK